MLVQFNTLPEYSRIWIYQANRSFTPKEEHEIAQKLEKFLENWTAHGADLETSYEIRYHRFIVIALNQEVNAASGCAIDASVHCIQQFEKEYQLNLLDKMNVSFIQNDEIVYEPLLNFKKMANGRKITPETIVFNHLVTTKEEYKTVWEVPAKESWHSRFFK
jgi:hypothetical protein